MKTKYIKIGREENKSRQRSYEANSSLKKWKILDTLDVTSINKTRKRLKLNRVYKQGI